MNNHSIWVERYRPATLNEYVFHDDKQRKSFERFVNDGTIPHLLLSGVQGSGKAQPLTCKVLTTDGWVPMGDINNTTVVKTPDGGTARVLGVYPQTEAKDVFEVTFHDGSSTQCCGEHLWECYYVDSYTNRTATKHVVSLNEIRNFIAKQDGKSTKFNVSIPLTTEVEFPAQHLHINPYLLGVLIGDGSVTQATPRITSSDPSIISECERLEPTLTFKQISGQPIEYLISDPAVVNHGGTRGSSQNRLTKSLQQYGLYGCRSHEKFIPREFLTTTINDRKALVRGLMDTDGTISERGNASYTTVSYNLAHDMQELFWSLGATCTISTRSPTYQYNGEQRKGKPAYDLTVAHPNGTAWMFNVERKRVKGTTTFALNHNKGDVSLRRRIVDIKFVGQLDTQCIKIDSKDSLYITDDYIVTHNTSIAKILITAMDLESTDVMVINASDENSVDVMRDKIKDFVCTYAMGDFKIVNLEEADYITPNGQAILRNIMEEFHEQARFILTCNYENKIIPAIKSRCQHFRFKASNRDDITTYAAKILLAENIKFDLDLLDKYVAVGYPDIRKIVNMLQQNSHDGVLDEITQDSESGDYKFELLGCINTDNWQKARNIVCSNVGAEEWEDVYRFLYENLDQSPNFMKQENWESGMVIIAEHLYKHSLVADPEINAASMFIQLGLV